MTQIGATDEQGKLKYVISPNLKHIAEAGTPEASYILGDVNSDLEKNDEQSDTNKIINSEQCERSDIKKGEQSDNKNTIGKNVCEGCEKGKCDCKVNEKTIMSEEGKGMDNVVDKDAKGKPAFGTVEWQEKMEKRIKEKQDSGEELDGSETAYLEVQKEHNDRMKMSETNSDVEKKADGVRDWNKECVEDAKMFIGNFESEIVDQLMDKNEASTDLYNDYPNGDSFIHETYVDKEYNLRESAAILETFDNETDSGLWEGLEPRKAISAQAAFTYGNAVGVEIRRLIESINTDFENMENKDEASALEVVKKYE